MNKEVETNGSVTGSAGGGQVPQSTIRGVSLASFLQLMKLEQKTCTLFLRSGENQGRIFMANGDVINAETGKPSAPTASGHNAFRRIMAWGVPAIDLAEGLQKVTREIRLPLMHLLMESQQMIDESRTEAPRGPGPAGTGDLDAAGKLGGVLSASDGVTAYEVTGPDGASVRKADGGLDIAPGELRAMGNSLGTLLNSRFKSLKIILEDNSSYWAGRINRLDVRVKLKPGFRPGKMME